MKIYKWVPIISNEQVSLIKITLYFHTLNLIQTCIKYCIGILLYNQLSLIKYFIFQKKKSKEHSHSNKENILGKRPIEATHSNFSIADDSNTCKITYNLSKLFLNYSLFYVLFQVSYRYTGKL